ncbi:MAG: hypothetical protein QGI05_00260 [Candidatus Omnitrophota bacterium]|nr:hypothetical protein [Candidatus Omnitrophota bacterium]
MFKKKISRGEFLKTGFLGILAILFLPLLKLFDAKKASHKEAKYYKNLAG